MKILYITPAFQHPAVRGPSRCYHFIRELAPRHEITMLTLNRSYYPETAWNEMASYLKEIRMYDANITSIRDNGKSGILSMVRRKVQGRQKIFRALKEMKQGLLELVDKEKYDVVLFHGKSVFQVIEDWDELPLVIDFCDATAMRTRDRMRYEKPLKRAALALRYRQFRKIEKRIIQKTPHVAFISQRDQRASLEERKSRANASMKIVPIGVDLNFWKRKTNNPQPNTIIFTGVMSYGPNEDAALYLIDKIIPLVRKSIPNIETLIVGRDPTQRLKNKAEHYQDIKVTGFVDDVRTYLEEATVFVAPVRYASGIQNKVLEAFAMEIPVICTPPVAEGLRFDGEGNPPVYVAEKPQVFAQNIVKLLNHPEERDRLSRAGRNYVEKHFVWSRSAEIIEEMCYKAAKLSERVSKN